MVSMPLRRITVGAAIVLVIAAAISLPALVGWARLRSARARFEAAAVDENQSFRENIGSVTVGMDRATVARLLGPPMLSGTTASKQRGDPDVRTEFYLFVDSINWGDTSYFLHGASVSVEYAAEGKTVSHVDVSDSSSLYCNVLAPITVEWLEGRLRRIGRLSHNPGVERPDSD